MRGIWNLIGLAVVMVVLAGCGGAQPETETAGGAATSDADLPPAPTISGPEARQLVAEGAFLLDVTPPPRNAESEIEGRTNIPLPELRDRLAEVPRDRIVVVYCYGGRGSPRGGAILQAEGYDARVLGGRDRWNEGLEDEESPEEGATE